MRRQQLQNSRFLIFPWVLVKNWASAALVLSLRQVADDWQERYQFRPVLCETFVETARFAATGYRALNWPWIGEIRGQSPRPPPRRGAVQPTIVGFKKANKR